jgi:thiamine-monophosphate kinase
MTVGDLGEFGLIAAIAARLPRGARTVIGVGDDAAVLATPDGRVVATTDLLVEARHFRRDWSGPADIGGKAAARNLADVAAMGATPVALLVGLATPADLPVAWAQDLVSGIIAECARTGATVVGGDVSSADTIMLAVTALGDLAGREPVTRAGARPGDLVAVAGVLGHSAAGLALLRAGLAEPAALVTAYRWPRPPYHAGPEAAALGATSMIDISDGLVADTGHVAEASGVLIDIDTARLAPGGDLLAAAARLDASGPAGPTDPAGPADSAAAGEPARAREGTGVGEPARPGGLAKPGESSGAGDSSRQGESSSGARETGPEESAGTEEPVGTGGLPGAGASAGPGDSAEPEGLSRPLVWMLTGGEDHALVATFPPGTVLPAHWTVIGQVRQGRGVWVDGQVFLGRPGWDHFI